MKKSELKQLIKEEIKKTLKEIDTFREDYIMGIKSMIRNNPEKQLDKFVSSELLRMGRERLEDLTREEAQKLNINLVSVKC